MIRTYLSYLVKQLKMLLPRSKNLKQSMYIFLWKTFFHFCKRLATGNFLRFQFSASLRIQTFLLYSSKIDI